MSQHAFEGSLTDEVDGATNGAAGSGSGGMRDLNSTATGEGSRQDLAVDAVHAFIAAIHELVDDSHQLERRLGALAEGRASGRSWKDILADEEPPGTMQLVSKMLGSLAKASGTLRKELVESLRREGVSIPAIARLFGVTHQRVSNLLRRPPE